MAKFKFSLETLLNHLLHHEEIIQKELSVLGSMIGVEKAILSQIQQDKDKAYAEINQKQLRGVDLSEHILYANFLEGLTRKIVIQQKKVKETEKKYAQKRDDLIEAVKKRNIIINLKEKGLAVYSRELLKLDQDFQNEVAISSFHSVRR